MALPVRNPSRFMARTRFEEIDSQISGWMKGQQPPQKMLVLATPRLATLLFDLPNLDQVTVLRFIDSINTCVFVLRISSKVISGANDRERIVKLYDKDSAAAFVRFVESAGVEITLVHPDDPTTPPVPRSMLAEPVDWYLSSYETTPRTRSSFTIYFETLDGFHKRAASLKKDTNDGITVLVAIEGVTSLHGGVTREGCHGLRFGGNSCQAFLLVFAGTETEAEVLQQFNDFRSKHDPPVNRSLCLRLAVRKHRNDTAEVEGYTKVFPGLPLVGLYCDNIYMPRLDADAPKRVGPISLFVMVVLG